MQDGAPRPRPEGGGEAALRARDKRAGPAAAILNGGGKLAAGPRGAARGGVGRRDPKDGPVAASGEGGGRRTRCGRDGSVLRTRETKREVSPPPRALGQAGPGGGPAAAAPFVAAGGVLRPKAVSDLPPASARRARPLSDASGTGWCRRARPGREVLLEARPFPPEAGPRKIQRALYKASHSINAVP